jgi:hypothetical protein
MRFAQALPLALVLGLPAFGPAAAQQASPWPQQPQQQQTSPWPQQPQQQQTSPWPQQGQPAQTAPWPQQPQRPQATFAPAPQQQMSPWTQQQEPPCIKDFVPLREEAAKRAAAVRTASEHKATPQEACQLIGKFSEAELKMVKFAETNSAGCGIPADAVKQMKTNHERTAQLHKNVCMAANNPARAAGPSLSDALDTSKIPSADSVKKGGGTYDTLTGNAIVR